MADNRFLFNKEDEESASQSSLPQPFGGLQGAALLQAIQQNPGPVATTGFNPSIATKVPEEESSEEESSSSPSPVESLIATGKKYKDKQAYPTPNARPMSDVLTSLLGANKDELSKAQEQRDKSQFAALLGRGIQQIGGALTPLAERRPDDEAFKTLMNMSQQPVQNIIEQKQNAMQAIKEFEIQDKLNPNSEQTKILKSLINQAAEKAGVRLTPEQLDSASPETLEKIQRGVESMANRAVQMQANQQAKEAIVNNKMTEQQAKAYSDMRQKLESFRGNKAAQQASADILSADKALMIVKNKEPNTLTTQDLRLLSTELAKIASGGVPGEHGTKDLMPNNLKTKFAEMQNFLTSKPTDADAGEYIQKNLSYLEEMKKVSENTLNKFRGNIIKGYKGRVTPEAYQEALEDYQLNKTEPAQKQASVHPQDEEAISWAKSNPSDPRSAAILRANGL